MSMVLNIFKLIFEIFKPFLIVFGLIILIFSAACAYWYFYFTIKEKRVMPEHSGTAPKRENFFKQLFVMAPRRFMLDYFEREPDYFGTCGLHIFCGEQGSGKTISAVEMILQLQEQYPKAKTITNFGLSTEDNVLSKWQLLLTYNNGKKGVICGIDEIQNWFKSGKNNLPEEMLEVVTQNRKNRRIIVCTAQVFTRVSKAIREQVTLVYEPHTFAHCFTIVVVYKPIFDSEGNVIRRKYRKMYSFVHTDELRAAYDTYKVIHALSKEGFKEKAAAPEITVNVRK